MKATATITLTEFEARALWLAAAAHRGDEDDTPPVGQDLANWIADFICTTLESNWQFDAGVAADVKAGAASETLHLLTELRQCEALLASSHTPVPTLQAARGRLAEIHEDLGLSHRPDQAKRELEDLLDAYATLLTLSIRED